MVARWIHELRTPRGILPSTHQATQSVAQRVHNDHGGACARERCGARPGIAERKGSGASAWHPDRSQGHLRHGRHPDNVRIAFAQATGAHLRCGSSVKPAGRRHRPAWKDEHDRVRVGRVGTKHFLWRRAQSLGPRSLRRRIIGRDSGRSRSGNVPWRHWVRHRGLDSHPGQLVRRRGDQADIRSR